VPKITILRNPPLARRLTFLSREVVELRFVRERQTHSPAVGIKWPPSARVMIELLEDGSLAIRPTKSEVQAWRAGLSSAGLIAGRISSDGLVSRDVDRVRYVHIGNNLAYQHDFERGAVSMMLYRRGGGVLHLFRRDGLPLYRFFPGVNR
jgi:hypothetical protein